MKTVSGVGLRDVQDVYRGAEGRLWELAMGQQIHIGGLTSSLDLADAAGIAPGMKGVDFCCCTGAGMRFLLRFREVAHMTGVDATEAMLALGRERCAEEGFDGRVDFVLADVCASGLPSASYDFVWGEDAWCYVEDKDQMIAEAARLVRPGGVIAFTDWVEGTNEMTAAESERFLRFMKFANIQDIAGYKGLLEKHDCTVVVACDTGRFVSCADLYIAMLTQQLTYDALKILGFQQEVMQMLGGELGFTRELAAAGKVQQALFVARRNA